MTSSPDSTLIDAAHPWPGLMPFMENASAFFHGRETETAELLRHIKRETLTTLFGQSGLGKSSLLNVLLKQDRAIVTPIAGTTRDAIEESAQIQGVPFQLIDTAGILEPRDLIEEEAML